MRLWTYIGLGGLVAAGILVGYLRLHTPVPPKVDPTAGATVEVHSLILHKPWSEEANQAVRPLNFSNRNRPIGTTILLYVTIPGSPIVALDPGDIEITEFTDDKNTDLKTGCTVGKLPADNPAFPHGTLCVAGTAFFHLATNALPASAARTLNVKATTKLRIGRDEKTIQIKGFSAAVGNSLKIGDLTLKVSEVNPPPAGTTIAEVGVVFVPVGPIDTLKSLRFITPFGEVIRSHNDGVDDSQETGQRLVRLILGRAVESMVVEATYYSRIETITFPIDRQIHAGL